MQATALYQCLLGLEHRMKRLASRLMWWHMLPHKSTHAGKSAGKIPAPCNSAPRGRA